MRLFERRGEDLVMSLVGRCGIALAMMLVGWLDRKFFSE